MTSGFRRLVLMATATSVLALIAVPAFAQSSSLVSGRSLMANVKFDAAATPSPTLRRLPTARLNAGAVRFARQDDDRGGIGLGVLAGIVRTSLSGEDVEDFFESSTGTMFGFWIGGNTNGLIGFTGEFNYIIRKQDIDADGDGDIDDEFSRPAFSIPAVFHINFGPEDRNPLFYVVLGPVFTFTLKQEIKIDGEGEAIDVGDDFNGADIGFLGGAGFEIYRIGVEVRHNWGLRSITSGADIVEIKTRAWEFLVKFRFN